MIRAGTLSPKAVIHSRRRIIQTPSEDALTVAFFLMSP